MSLPPDARPVDLEHVAPEVLEAFTVSLGTTFGELCAVDVTASEPFIIDQPLPADISASLILQGDPPGILLLAFPGTVLKELATRYLAGVAAPTDTLVEDAAGEFANVLAGQAKTMLKGTPHHYHLSLPSVSRGTPSNSPSARPYISWLCECEAGRFGLQVIVPGHDSSESNSV